MQAGAFLTQVREFLRDDSGAVAVEAAIIFPVGFFLVMGTVEMALYFFANSALNNAVKEMAYEAAQECKANEKVPGPDNSAVCGKIRSSQERENELRQILTTFSGNLIQLNPERLCIRVQSVVPAGLSNNLGGSNQIMRYDFSYRWQFFTPMIGAFFPERLSEFHASFLVRNGFVQNAAARGFSWMNGCNGFAGL